jgi:hypothetical protein
VRKLATFGAALALALTVTVVSVLSIGGAGIKQAAAACAPPAEVGDAASAAPVTAASADTTATLPASIGNFRGEQIKNAAEIIVAAQALNLDVRAQTIGVMTAIAESTLRNLDRGDQVGPDSRGLFQQRDNGAWGSYSDRMTPRIAATNFFRKLATIPDWETMPPTLAANAVQGNADPYHYEPSWPAAVQIVGILSGDPDLASKLPAGGGAACVPGATGVITGPGAGLGNDACSVVPDPTTGRGCLTPRMANIATQLAAQGWRISCWDAHAWNPRSSHPRGQACDVFPGRGGLLPTAEQKANGDALAATMQATAAQTGITYIIWYGRIWSLSRADEGWRPYRGGGAYDPGSIVGGHFDHLHLDVG